MFEGLGVGIDCRLTFRGPGGADFSNGKWHKHFFVPAHKEKDALHAWSKLDEDTMLRMLRSGSLVIKRYDTKKVSVASSGRIITSMRRRAGDNRPEFTRLAYVFAGIKAETVPGRKNYGFTNVECRRVGVYGDTNYRLDGVVLKPPKEPMAQTGPASP